MTAKPKILNDIPVPKDYNKHFIKNYDLEIIWKWIRPSLLYNKLLGFKGNFNIRLKNNDEKAVKLKTDIENIQNEIIKSSTELMKPIGIFQFFKCKSYKDNIIIYYEQNKEISINFPRQDKKPYLCLSDFINPDMDNIAFFVVSMGNLVKETSEKWKQKVRLKDSYLLQSIALAGTEVLADIIHFDIRKHWGIEENKTLSEIDNPKYKYRGLRYSFGYPSCPNLEYQQIIWDLLNPEEIGINLTENFMMEPEASISAMVIHHTEARYFNI